jgi:hypothetical protein
MIGLRSSNSARKGRERSVVERLFSSKSKASHLFQTHFKLKIEKKYFQRRIIDYSINIKKGQIYFLIYVNNTNNILDIRLKSK